MLPATGAFCGEAETPATAIGRRCRLELKAPENYQPWSERRMGVVEFYHGGQAQPDGGDVVVSDKNGVQNHCIMQAGPGDFLRVAFAFSDAESVCLSYGKKEQAQAAGAPSIEIDGTVAKPKDEEWLPPAGCILTTWPLPDNTKIDNFADMQRMLAEAQNKPPCGRDFVESIYHGYHYFGKENDRFVSRYVGWLGCSADGDYDFATTSDDASFLLVDDKLLVQWPGHHGAVGDARFNKKIKLTKGVHKIEYLHCNVWGDTIAVAAWRAPGMDKILPITKESFAPVARFSPVSIFCNPPQFSEPMALVQVENIGEAFVDDIRLIKMRFSSRSATAEKAATSWNFGDGASEVGEVLEHVYCTEGLNEVTMLAGGHNVKNRVMVAPLPSRMLTGNYDSPAPYLEVVAKYSFDQLREDDLAVAIKLMATEDKYWGQLSVACRALLARDKASPDNFRDAALLLGEKYRQRNRPNDAIEIYRTAIEKTADRKARAELIRQAGDTQFYYLKDLDAALNEYDKVVGRYADVLEANIVRVTKIKIGDIYRRKGDGAKARQAYVEAADLLVYKRDFSQNTVRKGALYKTAEDFLKRGELEEAKKWLEILEWEYPLEKLDGYSSIVRARIAEADGNQLEAQTQLLWFVVASPRSAYAAEAFFRSAELYLKDGKEEEAQRIVDKLANEYADSPYAEQARELLGGKNKKISN
jgi:TolA-binding protein